MRQEMGKFGEELAAKYLVSRGYRILLRNYRLRTGEIDIICTQNDTIVFVEVKARRSCRFGTPEEAVTKKKMEHIRQTAFAYLAEQNIRYKSMRFDVIAIWLQEDPPRINHIEAAF